MATAAHPIDVANALLNARLMRMLLAADRMATAAEAKGSKRTPADDARIAACHRDLQRVGRDLERAMNVALVKAGRPARYTPSLWT
jgi:hypothetical protein